MSDGFSLPKLLAIHRGYRNPGSLPNLKESEIVQWAKRHFQDTGRWPYHSSGRVICAPGETWAGIDNALLDGGRGLPGGSSVARVLAAHGLKSHRLHPPDLTFPQILDWADKFHERHGKWPIRRSGIIEGSPEEHWSGIDFSLIEGKRGLPGGVSLAELLRLHRGARIANHFPALTEDEIVR